ncbi:MAG: bifunctional phosphopantothenoylcysteine decarboxylase/phosphopantothenate--cysteine ligase CoaBC, partial [Muribaculaceae bacterium]|nr:bifunctional phosphopantothenoylcysteine decarboxylase/phosphopantothenate--cysteine ligase CoaBC [Muribaculaceae bacterium]
VMVAPAMDLDMWAHPSTQRNVATLKQDGVLIVEPQAGFLASGLAGKGRMEEPEKIVEAAENYLNTSAKDKDFAGKKVVISAGPTYENIDPVRFIGNYSSGKMGFALANEFRTRGAEVTIVAGPVCSDLKLCEGVKRVDVRNAKEMLHAMQNEYADADVAIMAAAVADYAPAEELTHKIKRENKDELTLKLVKNPDIAGTLGSVKGDRILVGFALETDNEYENAIGKMQRKNLDMIVLNSLRDPGAGMMTDTNKITIFKRNGDKEEFELKSKSEVASDIADAILSLCKR